MLDVIHSFHKFGIRKSGSFVGACSRLLKVGFSRHLIYFLIVQHLWSLYDKQLNSVETPGLIASVLRQLLSDALRGNNLDRHLEPANSAGCGFGLLNSFNLQFIHFEVECSFWCMLVELHAEVETGQPYGLWVWCLQHSNALII